MTDNAELKRLAERVIEIEARDGDEPIGEAWEEFEAVATPSVVLALIAENDRLESFRASYMEWSDKTDWVQASAQPLELGKHRADVLRDRIDSLKVEVAGLRTGYEAYERVNAELKAENERLERNRDMWKGQVERQAEELTAPRKRIDDMSPFKGAPFTGPDTKCLACGGYHYGMSGLPCPNMRITAQTDLPETRSGQIGAALGQGEQP